MVEISEQRPTRSMSAPKKELRTTLLVHERAMMVMMPVSQAFAWFSLVAAQFERVPIEKPFALLAIFYGAWAMYNRLFKNPMERGYYAFGTLYLGLYLGLQHPYGRAGAVLGALAVWIAFAVASTRVLQWPPAKLAYIAKKTYTWAIFMRGYWRSSLVLWPLVAIRLYLAP